MGAKDLLQQCADGTLMLGAKGERIVEHYSFYAVFNSPEEFRIQHAGHVLGSMAFEISLTPDIHIIFGGRRWRVVGVDTTAKVVTVEPAPSGRVPRFEGSRGGLVHDRIRKQMREVYETGSLYAYLNPEARALLTEARQAYARLGLTETTCVSEGGNTVLFLCRGDRILSTAAVLLLNSGLSVEVLGPAITIKKVVPLDVIRHLKEICAGPPPNAEELAVRVANKRCEKYDWVLDEPLLCANYAAQNLSVEDTVLALRETCCLK